MSIFMKRLMLGLLTLAFFAPTAAYSHEVFARFDLRNKSDQCVVWFLPKEKNIQGYLKPGASAYRSVPVHTEVGVHYSVRIDATIEDCKTGKQIGPSRYDYIPGDANSELSIHKQSPGVYIMRHGP
ncbi:MAG: hypothetical protein WBD74_01310 [Candidatus Aquilonibacter sp.]